MSNNTYHEEYDEIIIHSHTLTVQSFEFGNR